MVDNIGFEMFVTFLLETLSPEEAHKLWKVANGHLDISDNTLRRHPHWKCGERIPLQYFVKAYFDKYGEQGVDPDYYTYPELLDKFFSGDTDESDEEDRIIYLQNALYRALHSSQDVATDIQRIALTHMGINPDTGDPYAEED